MARVTKTLSTSLEANARYAVRARSINSLGVASSWSEALDFTTEDDSTIPSAPQNVSLTSGLRTLIVKWDPVDESDLAYYEIYIRPGASDFTPVSQELVIISNGNNTQIITRYHNGVSYADLIPGNTYTVKMRAVDVTGNAGNYSVAISATVGYLLDSDILLLPPEKMDDGNFTGEYAFTNELSVSGDLLLSGSTTLAGTFGFFGSGNIRTASSNSRAVMNTDGFKVYASDGTTTLFDFEPSDGTITLRTEDTSTRRIEIATDVPDSIQIYPDGASADPHLISTSSATNDVGTHYDALLQTYVSGDTDVQAAITIGNYSDLANPVGWLNFRTERQTGASSKLTYEMIMGWGAVYVSNDANPVANGTLMPFSGSTAEYFVRDPSGANPPPVEIQSSEYPTGSYYTQAGIITLTAETGEADVVLPRGFPNGILSVVITNIDTSTAKARYLMQVNSGSGANNENTFNVYIWDTVTNAAVVDGTTVMISYIAIGW